MTWDGKERRQGIDVQLAVLLNDFKAYIESRKTIDNDIKEILQKHDHFINGNGNVGAKTAIKELQTKVGEHQSIHKFTLAGVAALIIKAIWGLIAK